MFHNFPDCWSFFRRVELENRPRQQNGSPKQTKPGCWARISLSNSYSMHLPLHAFSKILACISSHLICRTESGSSFYMSWGCSRANAAAVLSVPRLDSLCNLWWSLLYVPQRWILCGTAAASVGCDRLWAAPRLQKRAATIAHSRDRELNAMLLKRCLVWSSTEALGNLSLQVMGSNCTPSRHCPN